MDTDVLVENRIEDGRKLVTELVAAGFDVSVAFWVRTAEEGLWFLYIGSNSVEPAKVGAAYQTLYTCLSRIPDPWVSLSEVQLIPASNPIAREAITARDRQPGRLPVRYPGQRLGSLAIDEAYIYPRVGGPMSPGEILQTLFGLASRPVSTLTRPAVITLRDGTTVSTVITGFDLQLPGSVVIHTLDPRSKTTSEIAGDEVTSIQP